jgi:hypothetical protein
MSRVPCSHRRAQTRRVRARGPGKAKPIVESDARQAKIEVHLMFRGGVLPVERPPPFARSGLAGDAPSAAGCGARRAGRRKISGVRDFPCLPHRAGA